MTNMGWSLPAGCGMLPGEEMLPPCCEDCPEELHTNCPGEDKCEIFQKLVRDEAEQGVEAIKERDAAQEEDV